MSAISDRVDALLLVDELAAASAEVSAIVSSAKLYSQVDSSPLGPCDINELLDSTLPVMSSRYDEYVVIEREYATDLPLINCYAAELN